MSAPKTQLINGLWNCTETDYHADSEYVSNSDLRLFRDSIPRYHGLRIAKTIKPDDDSSARALGTAVHACLLQPEKVNDLFLQWPVGDGKTSEVKRAREAVCKEAGASANPKVRAFNGRTIVTADEWETAQRMAEAARQHPLVAEMIEMPGYCEQSVRVEHPEYGKMKSRFDKLLSKGHIIEIKTSRRLHPEAFSRDAHSLGYHRQAAFYEDVRDLAMGPGQSVFVFVVICSIEPYETVVYRLEERARDLGRFENYQLLAEMRDRRERDDWSSRWAATQNLDLPYYAYPREQRR